MALEVAELGEPLTRGISTTVVELALEPASTRLASVGGGGAGTGSFLFFLSETVDAHAVGSPVAALREPLGAAGEAADVGAFACVPALVGAEIAHLAEGLCAGGLPAAERLLAGVGAEVDVQVGSLGEGLVAGVEGAEVLLGLAGACWVVGAGGAEGRLGLDGVHEEVDLGRDCAFCCARRSSRRITFGVARGCGRLRHWDARGWVRRHWVIVAELWVAWGGWTTVAGPGILGAGVGVTAEAAKVFGQGLNGVWHVEVAFTSRGEIGRHSIVDVHVHGGDLVPIWRLDVLRLIRPKSHLRGGMWQWLGEVV